MGIWRGGRTRFYHRLALRVVTEFGTNGEMLLTGRSSPFFLPPSPERQTTRPSITPSAHSHHQSVSFSTKYSLLHTFTPLPSPVIQTSEASSLLPSVTSTESKSAFGVSQALCRLVDCRIALILTLNEEVVPLTPISQIANLLRTRQSPPLQLEFGYCSVVLMSVSQ